MGILVNPQYVGVKMGCRRNYCKGWGLALVGPFSVIVKTLFAALAFLLTIAPCSC